MAIAFDNANNGTSAGTTSLTLAHTCTGSNLALVVYVEQFSSTDDLTGVTYNGVSMTRARANNRIGGSRWQYLYILLGAPSGAHNVVASCSSAKIEIVIASSYTGVTASGYDVVGGPGTVGSSIVSLTLTPTVDNAWIVYGDTEPSVANNYVGMTQRSGANGYNIFDTNGAITPPAAHLASFDNNTDGALLGVTLLPSARIFTAAQGSFSLTGNATTLSRVRHLVVAVGTFVLTGFTATFKYILNPWTNQSKNNSSWTNQTKD